MMFWDGEEDKYMTMKSPYCELNKLEYNESSNEDLFIGLSETR